MDKSHSSVSQTWSNSPGHPVISQPWWKLGGKDYGYVGVDGDFIGVERSLTTSSHSTLDNEKAAVRPLDGFPHPNEAENLYKIPNKYEGKHRFDAACKWTVEEEKALVRTLDWRIALPACIMFFALQLDRGNIAQALTDNFLQDLHLTTDDFNNGQTVFFCSFLFAELPFQLVSKKLGPDVWIPMQLVSWSTVAASQAALTRAHGRAGFYATRCLLGLLQGSFIPDTILYLSYFYKNDELPKRLSWFWTAFASTSIISSFLGYGILHLGGKGTLHQGWRYLFLIEGCFTGLIGVTAWLYLPASPTQTSRSGGGIKGLLRPKSGWFSVREETIIVTRILRDDPNKASMHNRQGLTISLFKRALTDYDIWPIYLLGLTWVIPAVPPGNYLPLTLRALGFNTFQTNLLQIPSSVLFIVNLLLWTWISDRLNQRLFIGIIAQLWVLPLLIALEVLPPHFHHSNWIKWAISTLIVGFPYPQALLVALVSRNSGSVETRTVSSALYNMTAQAAQIISSQIYVASDKPYYYRGNKILLGLVAWNVLAFALTKVYYTMRNNKRDEKWNSMTRDERVQYIATTSDKGNKRLDFRFAS